MYKFCYVGINFVTYKECLYKECHGTPGSGSAFPIQYGSAPHSQYGFAFPKQIQIQDSRMNTDSGESGSTTLGPAGSHDPAAGRYLTCRRSSGRISSRSVIIYTNPSIANQFISVRDLLRQAKIYPSWQKNLNFWFKPQWLTSGSRGAAEHDLRRGEDLPWTMGRRKQIKICKFLYKKTGKIRKNVNNMLA